MALLPTYRVVVEAIRSPGDSGDKASLDCRILSAKYGATGKGKSTFDVPIGVELPIGLAVGDELNILAFGSSDGRHEAEWVSRPTR